jgi:glycosyltransferase involved in cell wall biosynthesis
LVKKGSSCNFAPVLFIDNEKNIWKQIPKNIDVVHFQKEPLENKETTIPYVVTIHGNRNNEIPFDKNAIFVSKNHANRYQSESYTHNGLDWDDYSKPTFSKKNYFHFLGDASWRVKNVKGAIKTITATKKEQIKIMGGKRLNFNMGFRFTTTTRSSFCGMVGGAEKNTLLDASKGLIFPVRWHEPFGLAIIESLYFGCPVFGTPYGSLPEIITEEVGFLSNKRKELTSAVENVEIFSAKRCHEYAVETFNSKKMAISYLEKYKKVILGETLNVNNPKIKEIQKQKFLDWEK